MNHYDKHHRLTFQVSNFKTSTSLADWDGQLANKFHRFQHNGYPQIQLLSPNPHSKSKLSIKTTTPTNPSTMEWLTNRWVAASASILIQWSCGASYTFSIYSPILKSTQGYDQSTLDTVSVFKDIGANFGILSGLLYSAVTPYGSADSSTKSKWRFFGGPWVVHAAGAVQCFLGFMFIWAAVVGLIDRPHVGVMCFFAWLGSNGQTFLNTTNVVTGLRNFPEYSGTIVGIMKVLFICLTLINVDVLRLFI